MYVSSLICEYNPFHNGHKFMLDKMKNNGASHIVACMSGNFMQRGDFAIFDKYSRTRMALMNGADLVIEIPVGFACSGAERFAYGGVYILNAIGCIDEICFGSESGNIDTLKDVCNALTNSEISEKTKKILKTGITFAAAREKAVCDIFGNKISDILSKPNNILAVEYIKALKKINSNIIPSTITRTGVSHDSNKPCDSIASASFIRDLIYTKNNIFFKYIPNNLHNIYIKQIETLSEYDRMKKLSDAFIYKLRTMLIDDFAKLPDISEGLENRIYSSVQTETNIDDILSSIKCKRYTLARIRRCLLYAFLGITKKDLLENPPYIKILGFNEKGREILRIMRKTAKLPVIMRYADIKNLSTECKKTFEIESRCDDIYYISGKNIIKCGKNFTENLIIL